MQNIEILPPRYCGTNKTYKLQVALDGVHFIEEPFVTLTVKNDGIRDEAEFISCGKKDIEKVVVKHVEQGTGKELAAADEFLGYYVSMVQQYPIQPKEIPGYQVVKEPEIDWNNDYVFMGVTYVYEYVKIEEPDIPVEPTGITGDVNGDGTVDTSDAQAIFNHFMGIQLIDKEELLKLADVNEDGTVDTSDAQKVFNIFMGIH